MDFSRIWEYRSIAHRIEEFHTLLAALKRACFGLSIAHDGCDNQFGVIEKAAPNACTST